ncbi:DUF1043 family protein [Aquisalimonas lutea]|uniref:YhcB family protein n=1 Tax=Aquisalimonas lutea TaxID=1327750 RepID=UPI0025B378DF|nr:DUF1043 family protein [Aquisalimonas lutea]MDN3518633.1 DUF1043 family protein [Aquisalimonas lutea]
MTTIVWIIVVLVCLAGGIWLGRYTAPGVERSRALEKERDEAQAELQRYREDVRNHFEKTAHLFNQVTTGYRQLYEHLAEGSERLGTGENARMLENRPEDRTLQTPDDAADRTGERSAADAAGQERQAQESAPGAAAAGAAAPATATAATTSAAESDASSAAPAEGEPTEHPEEDEAPRQATDYAPDPDGGAGETAAETAAETSPEEGGEAAAATEKSSGKN